MRRLPLILSILLLCCSFSQAAAWPGHPYEIARPRAVVKQYAAADQSVSSDRAAEIARAHIKGRILSVKRSGDTWRVKILSSKGEVHVVVVDARSGKIVSPK